jgi:hypothetical protein
MISRVVGGLGQRAAGGTQFGHKGVLVAGVSPLSGANSPMQHPVAPKLSSGHADHQGGAGDEGGNRSGFAVALQAVNRRATD